MNVNAYFGHVIFFYWMSFTTNIELMTPYYACVSIAVFGN